MPLASDDDLALTRTMFEQWRATRTTSTAKLPDPLWQAAMALSDCYSVAQICRELRLNETSLRQHLRAAKAVEPAQTSFVAVPAEAFATPAVAPNATAEQIHLVWEKADGTRLHLCLPGSQWAQAESLCTAFLRC